MTTEISRAVEILRNARRVGLLCHVNPDGDALGSMLGMWHVLVANGTDAVACVPDGFKLTAPYEILPGIENIVSPKKFPENLDVVLTFDCGALSRLGGLGEKAKTATEMIVVDHHVSNEGYGTVNLIDPEAAASGVIVRALIAALDVPLTRDVAYCLYVALVSDTGRFEFGSTTPEVFGLAAELASFDLPIARISRKLFSEHPFAYLQLLGDVLQHMHLDSQSRFVWALLTQEQLKRFGLSIEEADDLIEVIRQVQEARVACVMKEEPDGSLRVSLRAVDIDVRSIAEQFGGGGHRLAAGFHTHKAPEVLASEIVEQLRLRNETN